MLTLVLSCSSSESILKGHTFDEGDWILVNVNYVEETLEIIDDETILKKYKNGIGVTSIGDCAWTTCDGFLKLFKNGILIKEVGYLTRSRMYLYESNRILESYKTGKKWTIKPKNKSEFKFVWDSLKMVNCYPTIYNTQPENKDIIVTYNGTVII